MSFPEYVKLQVLARCPLLEQNCRWIFVTEQSRHRLLEAAAEKHGGANIFLLPAIQIAMAVAAGAGQVLGNLGVAVIHRDAVPFSVPLPLTVGRTGIAVASSSHWLAGAKPSKFTSEMPLITVWLILTTPTQTAQGTLVDLVLAQQFGVIEKIPQEPTQLPHRLRGAVEAADNRAPGERLGFKDGEPQQIKALLGLPAVLGAIEPDEKYAVRNLGVRIPRGVRKSGNIAFHPDHLLTWGCVAVELTEQAITVPLGCTQQAAGRSIRPAREWRL